MCFSATRTATIFKTLFFIFNATNIQPFTKYQNKAQINFRANAFNFFNPELEQAKASDGYRMFASRTDAFSAADSFKCVPWDKNLISGY